MKDNILGKFKSYILFFLLILAFVQAGILWSSHTQRISFNYVSKLFLDYSHGKEDNEGIGLEKYLRPNKLIISSKDGLFSIDEGNKKYDDIIRDIIKNLKFVFESTEPIKINEEVWQEKLGKKAIYFFYSNGIPIELFNDIFKIKNNIIPIKSIEKIAIYSINEKGIEEIEIILKSNDGTYKYINKDKKNIIDLMGRLLLEKEDNSNYSGMLIDLFKSRINKIGEPEILYNDKEPLIREYNTYSISPIPINKDKNSFLKVLLDNKEYLYVESKIDNYIELINSRSIYKVILDGLNVEKVEYKYIGDNDSRKMDILSSFSKVVKILEGFKEYESSLTEFRIASIEETNTGYTFNFSYTIEGEKLVSISNGYSETASFTVEGDKIVKFNVQLLSYGKKEVEKFNLDYLLLFNTKINNYDAFITEIEIVNYYEKNSNSTIAKWKVDFLNISPKYYELLKGK